MSKIFVHKDEIKCPMCGIEYFDLHQVEAIIYQGTCLNCDHVIGEREADIADQTDEQN